MGGPSSAPMRVERPGVLSHLESEGMLNLLISTILNSLFPLIVQIILAILTGTTGGAS